MDLTLLRCLINSISRFILLVTCNTSKMMPAEEDFRDLASLLKHLKPLLDNAADQKANQDEVLTKKYEELDVVVNEAREVLEKWSPKMSKILFVLRSKPLLLKIQISSVDLYCMLCKLSESSPTTPSLLRAQEAPTLKLGKLAEQIEDILQRQKEGGNPSSEHLKTITESLGLKSSQEFLSECIALEKERQRAKDDNTAQISEIVDLMSHIRGFLVKQDNFKALNGIQIPSYFRCPLSFEIMSDPVIVASGQTYERAAIQKWLDHGLEKCPKTGNMLSHKNLIPNYTVKALVESWCSENHIELFGTSDKPEAGSVQQCSEHTAHEARNSTSQSSAEVGDGLRTQSVTATPGREDGYCSLSEKLNQSSPDYSYVHSRSESESSAVSSTDYLPTTSTEVSRISGKNDDVSDRSGDITSGNPTSSNQVARGAASLSAKPYSSSKTMGEMEKRNPPRTLSFSSDSGAHDSTTTTSNVEKLVNDLKSASTELQTAAAGELRFLAKYNMENRSIIGQCGAIGPLISLLHSEVELTQEHAVTALLNLSINEQIKARIAEEGALEPLIHILRNGSASGKENAAAALFSISLIDEFRIKIGRSGAVKALVNLLGSGTVRGKKDAATALFNLSIYHDNKARIIQAGAVKYLVELIDPESELVDKAVAVLANLSTVAEGCSAIAREEGIPPLVEIIETGSQRGKENAASILLQMCINSPKHCQSVLQEGVVPPLVALSQSGTPRAKEKSQQLLSHFRNQRENAKTRGRS